jgi:uncharacterized protein (TIGR02266 family)
MMGADDRLALSPMRAPLPRRPAARASERRDRVRCEVRTEIDVESAGGSATGVTRDLSEAGVFVVTDLERAVGTLLELRLHLPSEESPIRCFGEVRWCREMGTEDEAHAGLGLRFVALEPESRRRLQAFLLAQAPLDTEE